MAWKTALRMIHTNTSSGSGVLLAVAFLQFEYAYGEIMGSG